MSVPSCSFLRRTCWSLASALTLSVGIIGCDKATDPDPVELDELKFAFGLKILDRGNGAIRLRWTGVNNEEDFSGYNIYGVKENADITKLEGKAIKLLDEKGDPDAAGKATIGKMGYNGNNWETAGPSTNEDGDFAVYPYYKVKTDDDAVLPSCLPSGEANTDGTECKAVTTEGSTGTFNGPTYFDISGLKIGSTYCFTILATLDSGKKAAPATSEVRCIIPRASLAPSTSLTGASGKHLPLDLAALRTACGTTGGTSCGSIATTLETGANGNCDSGDQTLCLNTFSDALYFTASPKAGIQDLGYYASGFDDPTLPKVPKITERNTLQNLDGYSLKGQSLPVVKDHIYAIAEGDADGAKNFYYHLVLVKEVSGLSTTVEFRIANKIDTP